MLRIDESVPRSGKARGMQLDTTLPGGRTQAAGRLSGHMSTTSLVLTVLACLVWRLADMNAGQI